MVMSNMSVLLEFDLHSSRSSDSVDKVDLRYMDVSMSTCFAIDTHAHHDFLCVSMNTSPSSLVNWGKDTCAIGSADNSTDTLMWNGMTCLQCVAVA
jgi:hypothetical protein